MMTPNYQYDPSTIPPSIRKNGESNVEIYRVDILRVHEVLYYRGDRRVDLGIFVGSDDKQPLPKSLKDFEDENLDDLVARTDGRLPIQELIELRTLLKILDVNTQFKRTEQLCAVCEQY